MPNLAFIGIGKAGFACCCLLLEQGIIEKIVGINLSPEQHEYLKQKFDQFQQNWAQNSRQAIEAEEIQLSQIKDRLNRLTDAYLDNAVDRERGDRAKKM